MKALVTGGGGFLGSAIVKRLLERNIAVRSIQRGHYPHLIEWGVQSIRADLSDYGAIQSAFAGCDVVFHVAAKAGVWGDDNDYYLANVIATENVIKACQVTKVKYLIFTSTPSVVFDGEDEEGIDESAAYVEYPMNAYQRTKTIAEKSVLASSSEQFKTVALRPHLIWGPNDPHLVPRLLNKAKSGRLRMVGSRQNKVDSCYIDNAAHAHILAMDALIAGRCSGKAYFISNDEPLPMAELLNRILQSADIQPVTKHINSSLAYCIGTLLETIYSLLKIKKEPLITRFVARQLATAHWFDLTAAKKDLNYAPLVSIEQGLAFLKKHLQDCS